MRPLNIISVHNHYLMAGGEDQVFASEARLLRERGHQVTQVEETLSKPCTRQLLRLSGIGPPESFREHRTNAGDVVPVGDQPFFVTETRAFDNRIASPRASSMKPKSVSATA